MYAYVYSVLFCFVLHRPSPHAPSPNSDHLPSSYSFLLHAIHHTHNHSVIDENKEKLALQYDLDGKTALDLALEEDIFSKDNISKDVVFTLFLDLFDEVYGKYGTYLLKKC